MSSTTKRKAAGDLRSTDDKRTKTKKQWKVPHKNTSAQPTIQYGDTGIFATCPRGKEGACTRELKDLYDEYAKLMYGDVERPEDDEPSGNIEGDILAELADLKKPQKKQLFTSVRLDIQCVIFFKTAAPIEPVSFVERICDDLAQGRRPLSTRFTQRLTPVTLIGHASAEGLDKVARQVLAPYFHCEPQKPHKFAIRPNMRNHVVSPRDVVIKQVATIVGPGHSVDLHHYDYLILVEFYQNVCGMGVVTGAYERLKRFNLAELAQIDQDPLPDSAEQAPTEANPSSRHSTLDNGPFSSVVSAAEA